MIHTYSHRVRKLI